MTQTTYTSVAGRVCSDLRIECAKLWRVHDTRLRLAVSRDLRERVGRAIWQMAYLDRDNDYLEQPTRESVHRPVSVRSQVCSIPMTQSAGRTRAALAARSSSGDWSDLWYAVEIGVSNFVDAYVDGVWPRIIGQLEDPYILEGEDG